MSLIVNRPYPIRICYLKNQQKVTEQQQQQKVSLTFLSSFIQQQRHSLKNSQHAHAYAQENSFITSLNKQRLPSPNKQNENVQEGFGQKLTKLNINAITSYQKWKRKKSKSQIEEKRLLTNLVGTDWAENCHVPEKLNYHSLKKNRKKTIKQRLQTFQDDQRKNINKRLMQSHFKTFLSQKKQKPANVDIQQTNCFVTKMDNRVYQSLNPSFLDQFKGMQLRSTTVNSNHSEFRIQRQKHNAVRNNSMSMGSTFARHGFKQIPDFKWSKLSGNQKFKLNDHS